MFAKSEKGLSKYIWESRSPYFISRNLSNLNDCLLYVFFFHSIAIIEKPHMYENHTVQIKQFQSNNKPKAELTVHKTILLFYVLINLRKSH